MARAISALEPAEVFDTIREFYEALEQISATTELGSVAEMEEQFFKDREAFIEAIPSVEHLDGIPAILAKSRIREVDSELRESYKSNLLNYKSSYHDMYNVIRSFTGDDKDNIVSVGNGDFSDSSLSESGVTDVNKRRILQSLNAERRCSFTNWEDYVSSRAKVDTELSK